MIRESYIQELEDTLLEVIEKKDQKTSRRFIIALVEKQERDNTDIMHSIELLATQMSSIQKEMNTRFESMDKRFESMDKRFESLQREIDKRFDAVDKRIDSMDKRFEALTKRIDRFMIWSFGLTVTMAGVIIAVLKMWR